MPTAVRDDLATHDRSQMAEAVYDATSVDIESNGVTFRATGQILKFDGFHAGLLETRRTTSPEEVEGLLPDLETRARCSNLNDLEAEQHFTQPPPRYTEATLVKRMEEVGIGRPSTYAPTVRTLNRSRVHLRTESRRLFLVARGEVVTELMEAHFPDVVDVDFTARMEEELDEIAEGDKEHGAHRQRVLRLIHPACRRAEGQDAAGRSSRPTRSVPTAGGRWSRSLASTAFGSCRARAGPSASGPSSSTRKAIRCPTPRAPARSARSAVTSWWRRRGRFGPFVGCSNYPECKYIKRGASQGDGRDLPRVREWAGREARPLRPLCRLLQLSRVQVHQEEQEEDHQEEATKKKTAAKKHEQEISGEEDRLQENAPPKTPFAHRSRGSITGSHILMPRSRTYHNRMESRRPTRNTGRDRIQQAPQPDRMSCRQRVGGGGLLSESLQEPELPAVLPRSVVSSLGDWIGVIAIAVFAHDEFGTSGVGFVMTARVLPGFVVGPMAGVFADR